MLKGGYPTGRGLTLRVYEVRADGTRRELGAAVQTYGSRQAPASIFEPRRHAEANDEPTR